jgi:WD40 repeat protein
MEQDASLRRYRDAFRAHPELSVRPRAGSADETVLARGTPPDVEAASRQSPFPPHFEILEKIAETNLSTTWKVMDHERKSPVVLKEPQAHLLVDTAALERFQGEVHLASKLSHANIVPILATHLAEPPVFFTMPLIEGEHLDRYCDAHGLPLRARLALFLKVCRAVTYAHQLGVIHRDLKPNNILVDKNGEPQLLDFGLGRVLDTGERPAEAQGDVVMGSPGYMAPEQAAGLTGDTRTDVYALGVILYQLLTGQLPIPPTQDLAELTRRIRADAPADPRRLVPGMHRDLAAIVLHALKKEPAQRYAGVADFARDVKSYLAGKPVSAVRQTGAYVCARWLRRNWIGVSAAGVVIAGVLGFTAFAVRQSIETARVREDAATARATKDREVAAAAENGRHRMAVLYGRSQARDGNPASATAVLWQEQLRYDSVRTRYALWELYQRYPCRYAVGEYGRQTHVRFSPDGQYLATVGTVSADLEAGGPVRLFRADDGTVVAALSATMAQAKCLCFTPDGRALLVGGADGRVRWFDFQAETGALLVDTPRDVTNLPGPVSSITFSTDGTLLAAVTARGSVQVLSRDAAGSWQPAHVWQVAGEARGLAFSPDGQHLACAAHGLLDIPGSGGLTLWNLDSGIPQTAFAGAGCRSVIWSEDGQWLFSGEGLLVAWNPEAGKLKQLGGAPWGLRSLDAPGHLAGRYIAAASGDGRIRFHDWQRGADLDIAGFHACTADQVDLAFSPDARLVASVGCDGLRVWDFLPAQEFSPTPVDDPNWLTRDVALSADGKLLAVVQDRKQSPGANGAVSPGAEVEGSRLVICEHWSMTPAYSVILASPMSMSRPRLASDGHTIACIETNADRQRSRILVCEAAHPEQPPLVAELPVAADTLAWLEAADCWLLIGAEDGTVSAWRIPESGRPTSAPELICKLADACTWIASDPEGRWLAACNEGEGATASEIVVWRAQENPSTLSNFDEVYAQTARIRRDRADDARQHTTTWHVAFCRDADGRELVAAAGGDPNIDLYDAATGTARGRLTGHTDSVFHLYSLGDEEHRLLVSWSRDDTVRIWDAFEQEELFRLIEAAVTRLAVRNGRILLADPYVARLVDTNEIAAHLERNRPEAERLCGNDRIGADR